MIRYLSAGALSVAILAILVGLVGAYGVRSLLLAEHIPEPSEPSSVTMPRAAADLPAGRQVVMGDIALTPMTRQEVRESGWALDKVMRASEQIIGRTLKESVSANDPFLTSDLYLDGTGPNPIQQLKPGYRAVGLTVPYARGGFVTEGTTVDVVVRVAPRTSDRPGEVSNIPETTSTLVQGAEVLSVQQRRSSSSGQTTQNTPGRRPAPARSDQPPTIFLAVTSDQAQVLTAVQDRGEIVLVPRASGDIGSALRPSPVTLDDVLGIRQPPGPARFETEIYRGQERKIQRFEDGRLTK